MPNFCLPQYIVVFNLCQHHILYIVQLMEVSSEYIETKFSAKIITKKITQGTTTSWGY